MTKIKELRKAKGISQCDLADKLGINQASVAMWETGKAVPSTDKLPKLAEIFGCTIDELFKRSEDKCIGN